MNGHFDAYPASESISPELVLVDPELAARVRAHAVAGSPYAALSGAPTPTVARHAPAPAAAPAAPVAPPQSPRPLRRAPARIGWAVTLLALVGLLGAAFAGPRHAPTIEQPLTSPAPTITLGWQPRESTSYYVVEIFSEGRSVHLARTTRTRIPVPAWLAPGRYTWTVRPAGADNGVAEPTENGWFVVAQ